VPDISHVSSAPKSFFRAFVLLACRNTPKLYFGVKRYYKRSGDGWPDLQIMDSGHLGVDDHNLDSWEYLMDAFVPHCERRVGM